MNQTPFDNDYLVRLRQGDVETERHFVQHFSNAIRLSLRHRLRSSRLIEDIRQETFLRVLNFLRSDKSMDHPERLGAFLHSVSINVMIELLRASTRHPAMPEDAHDLSVNPEGEVVTRERKDLARNVLCGLPEKDRRILRTVFFEDAGNAEMNRDELRVLVRRAKIRFHAALSKTN